MLSADKSMDTFDLGDVKEGSVWDFLKLLVNCGRGVLTEENCVAVEAIAQRLENAELSGLVDTFRSGSGNLSQETVISRLKFTQQTATNAMIGYILGIGDRHLNNILVDSRTGEPVHIDMGIVFGQGRALKYPELVPFRLTAAIEDGMGWKGKDGVFRKSCEESLRILRGSTAYLLTVLEVLVDDPLYTWTVLPRRARQDGEVGKEELKDVIPKTAQSVVMTCMSKLEGREGGEGLSVEGHVAQLIHEATDDANLSEMWVGWRPWI
jgi:ataxia telangiectasia mutated family protein